MWKSLFEILRIIYYITDQPFTSSFSYSLYSDTLDTIKSGIHLKLKVKMKSIHIIIWFSMGTDHSNPYTVEPPIMDTPRSGQPPYNGQTTCPLPIAALTAYIFTSEIRTTRTADKRHAPRRSLVIEINL